MYMRQSIWALLMIGLVMAFTAPMATAELVDNGDGTITDTISGLMWLKNANTNGSMNWAAANSWVGSLNSSAFAGHSDWRLPSGANRDGSGAVCNSQPAGANCLLTEFATLYFARLIMFGNPGPFQNLQAGSYWTSTSFPANSAQAMAQDFIDGGQNPFDKSRAFYAWAVRDAGQIILPKGTPLLYGVVNQGTNAGALILIDTQNAFVSIVGPTTFDQACGLTFDRFHLKLYLNPCFGQPGIQTIDMGTGTATPLDSPARGVRPIAHRHINDRIYGIDLSPALLSLDTATGGNDLMLIGAINKISTGGIATRPSDGQLFGIGMVTQGDPWTTDSQQLFTLKPTRVNGFCDTNIGAVRSAPIRALTFHPDGRLFATDGMNLLTLSTVADSNGRITVISRIPFTGATIGHVGGLAVTGPTLAPLVDVWLKDCQRDVGTVPSSPAPCSNWLHSPDIMVDNNADGTPDPVIYGQTNMVTITVRNRGQAPVRGVVVRLYAYRSLGSLAPPSISNATFIGQTTANLGTGRFSVARVSIPWMAPRVSSPTSTLCLYVVLDHPSDRAKVTLSPPLDNNRAVNCIQHPRSLIPSKQP